MTLSASGARSLLKSQIYQSTRWSLLRTFSSSSLQLIQNLHRNTAPQCLKREKLQFPTRSLSSSPVSSIDSKRTPSVPFNWNEADVIEENMLVDGFRTWGVVTYRCTYKSESDWQEFMRRFLGHVRDTLEYHDGLDMLDSFVPTVMDDKKRFDGVTPAIVRDYFRQWARVACETEQGVTFDRAQSAYSARYKLCIMVDDEALQSVLDIPSDDVMGWSHASHVILIDGKWEPYFLSEEDLKGYLSPPPENNFEPVHGCTLEDVGWMKVHYHQAQIMASGYMRDDGGWEREYRRPPEIGFYC